MPTLASLTHINQEENLMKTLPLIALALTAFLSTNAAEAKPAGHMLKSELTIGVPRQAELCVDVPGERAANGVKVFMYKCHGRLNQRFTHVNQTLQVMGYCLELPGGKATNGTRAQLWKCNGGNNQKWVPHRGGFKTLARNITKKAGCLDVIAKNKRVNGAAVGVWDCWGGKNQKFKKVR